MTTEQMIQKLEEVAKKLNFGEFDVKFTTSRGKIVKATLTSMQEVIIFNS